MGDRRHSLIDQLALVAALQEVSGEGTSDEDSSNGHDSTGVLTAADRGLVFNSDAVAEEFQMVDEEDGRSLNGAERSGEVGSSEVISEPVQYSDVAAYHPDSRDLGQDSTPPSPGRVSRLRSHVIKRPSIKITVAGGVSTLNENDDVGTPSRSIAKIPVLARMALLSPNRRQKTPLQFSLGSNIHDAITSRALHGSYNEWENVASSSVTGATGSTQASGSTFTRHIRVGDTVLVFLTLLNVTNADDSKDAFTVAPVNRLGFPQGEGRTDEEKVGPYIFVLATVNRVHFDEDDRYYTVVRADTGTEQRADSGWIEPVNDPAGIEAASRAAKLTLRSAQDKPAEVLEETGYLHDARDFVVDIISRPTDYGRSKLLPWYQKQRANAKHTTTLLLFGDSPFSCRMHFTGINFLVFCSITFLFLDVINLAFLPATYDKQVSIVGAVVWVILVLELIFEVLIRPKGYSDLIQSDRAYSPSTSRYINRFHLIFESLALVMYIAEFTCIGQEMCDDYSVFSRMKSSLDAIIGKSRGISARGRFVLGLTVLRLFGPIRHWKQMFIKTTFHPAQAEDPEKWRTPRTNDSAASAKIINLRESPSKKTDDDNESHTGYGDENVTTLSSSDEDQHLKNAATIGTALMVVNSHRALVLMTAIVVLLPLLQAFTAPNVVAYKMVDLLQAHNVAAPTNSSDDCEYLKISVTSWLQMATAPQPSLLVGKMEDTYVLWAQLLPVRCAFQREDGVITSCEGPDLEIHWEDAEACAVWDDSRPPSPKDATASYFAEALKVRSEGIQRVDRHVSWSDTSTYDTRVIFNQNPSVSLLNTGDFIVLLGILFLALHGLNALRGEAIRLVLDPLQRMLKIVLQYAENPLSQEVKSKLNHKDSDNAPDADLEEIGNYETEQLINAITKIADLLRKCWGVAGAGIISSNLARTKDGKTVVFNPTVPGKRVYALFGFVAINGFSEQLRALERDVMILINDVAKVVHDEVYRWALGDHGQCNKNLGAAFLMVFRIGDFSEVQKKKQVATEKLFREYSKTATKRAAGLRKRNTSRSSMGRSPHSSRKGSNKDVDGQLQLASLPGIQAFTDRALLGMLKSFAGVHRDKQLTVWRNDFRLSAGVSAYRVDIIYGMDAGWAVEGAVGSEYKIDATYLSPHVNMASRMMSASKQYGVTILLSKAVEELLSRTCRKKLRHLDTVFVKGSKVKQEIFTYDARYQGVDFFLLERTPEQADLDAESYAPNIWEHDSDLLAMRQHISDAFVETYHLGVKQYLAGKWQDAYKTLERADDIMMETVLADGYLEYDVEALEGRILNRRDQSEDIVRIRHRIGDGACRILMTFMERRNFNPPEDWDGVRQLSSK